MARRSVSSSALVSSLALLALTATPALARAQVRAFPGAEGFGAVATGGRGGNVIKVTTLARTGAGSLQAALNASGPRVIVFDVSGVIEGDIDIPRGDVTIAGQTAPGAGITIHGRLTGEYDYDVQNIIVRHLRVRPTPLGDGDSDGDQYDAIQFSRQSKVILDHVTASWGSDETVDFYESKDVTVQWSTIEESGTKGHPEGRHNYGLINGPDGARISVHHNLFAHHRNRCPALATGPAEVRNNVAYDVEHGFVHHNPASGAFNIVGNYFRKGPSAALFPFYFDDEAGGENNPTYYVRANYVDDPGRYDGLVTDPFTQTNLHPTFDQMEGEGREAPQEASFTGTPGYVPVTTQADPKVAYEDVLARAGAFPRDVVTTRTITEVKARTGQWGARPPANLMEGLTAGKAPVDADKDGIADEWEVAHGLSPQDATDNVKVMPSGYTAIEDYVNELADAKAGMPAGGGGGGGADTGSSAGPSTGGAVSKDGTLPPGTAGSGEGEGSEGEGKGCAVGPSSTAAGHGAAWVGFVLAGAFLTATRLRRRR